MTLSRTRTYPENIKPGMLSLYFETSDITEAHKELNSKEVAVNDIMDDLFATGIC